MLAHHFQRHGVPSAIEEQVRFARRRFEQYEVIDFLAVLLGYAVSSERTLEAFYKRIEHWASAFMARERPLVNGLCQRVRMTHAPAPFASPVCPCVPLCAPVCPCVPLCAPGDTGRKRGEVVRTRPTVLHAHTHQCLASFGNPGNGRYREELRSAVAAIQAYVKTHDVAQEHALLRLDGQYGTGAVLSDLA